MDVKVSDNPEMIQAYMDAYPDGRFSALAALSLEELLAAEAQEPAEHSTTTAHDGDPGLLESYVAFISSRDLLNSRGRPIEEAQPDHPAKIGPTITSSASVTPWTSPIASLNRCKIALLWRVCWRAGGFRRTWPRRSSVAMLRSVSRFMAGTTWARP